MIFACHLVWTAYGWWFPNDPRGSWSKEIWKPGIRCLAGPPAARNNRAIGRRPIQPTPAHLQHWLKNAQKLLKYPPVILDSKAQELALEAILQQVQLHQYVVPALAVMPEHVHVVVEKHEHRYERIVNAFKSVSARALRKYFGLAASPATRLNRAAGGPAKRSKRAPVWSRRYWVRYLDSDKAIATATAYIKRQAGRLEH